MAATDYQANITNGTTNVDIMITTIEQNFDKTLTLIHVPQQDPNLTWIIDLQRLKNVITIVGWFQDESGSSGLTKKKNLETMMGSTDTMVLVWGTGGNQQSYSGSILKVSVREQAERRGNEGGSEEKTFTIQLQFIVGDLKP